MSPRNEQNVEALRYLVSIVPFRYLRSSELEALVADSASRRFSPGEVLLRQGDEEDDAVLVLLSGSVESVDVSRTPPFRLNVVEAGSYFGERTCLFGEPRRFEVRALEDSTCLAIPGPRFIRLLAESRPFAQAFGAKLREGLGLFDAFDRFSQEVARGVDSGRVDVRALVEVYKRLEPALHPLANDPSAIDWDALSYAVRRLPSNLCSTFVFLVTDNLPTVYASPELLFPAIESEARHRYVYEMMPGKDMVLVRNGMSDIMDFLSCLCVFAVEARKIRYRLNHPSLIRSLARFEDEAEWVEPCEGEPPRESGEGVPPRDYDGDIAAGEEDSPRRQAGEGGRAAVLLERLPFSEEEARQLDAIWPGEAPDRVREMVFHRQAFSVDVRKQVNNYNNRLSELWASEVGAAAGALLGVRPGDFPGDWEVHIVSSNTHSVSNCLNPWFAANGGRILDWAEGRGLRGKWWPVREDEVYHLSRAYLSAFPEAREELRAAEREAGILRLPETVTTGIQVQLVDLEAARRNPADPGLTCGRSGPKGIIVNIDYAFGEQAEEITRDLLLLFGRNVRSIDVLGKAGALSGSRGDIIIPTAFVEQADDTFMPVASAPSDTAARLGAALPGRTVHAGPLLTVGGTLLQNRNMLQFYRRIWGCVGLEMEGAWYLRAVHEAEELGVLAPGATTRFLYYVSDLPLETGMRLSERLGPLEGVPPLYAVTREVLSRILG